MPHLRAFAFVLLVVLTGGPVLTVVCEAGCVPGGATADARDASCHSTAPEAADEAAVAGLTFGGCDHGDLEDAVLASSGSPSGAFHKAAVESVVSGAIAAAAPRGFRAEARAPAPPESSDTGFAVPLRI